MSGSGGSGPQSMVRGNDPRLYNKRAPVGEAGGDLGGQYPHPTVISIGGIPIEIHGDGILLVQDGRIVAGDVDGPVIGGLPPSGPGTDGYLRSNDWTTFNQKQNSLGTGGPDDYLSGDLSWQNFIEKARGAISGIGDISYDPNTGVISYTGSGGGGSGVTYYEQPTAPGGQLNIGDLWLDTSP